MTEERKSVVKILESEEKARARKILDELLTKGYKEVGGKEIKDLWAEFDDIDYEGLFEIYENVLRKENKKSKQKQKEMELHEMFEELKLSNYEK